MQKNIWYIAFIVLLGSCSSPHKVSKEVQKVDKVKTITYPTHSVSGQIKISLSKETVTKLITRDKDYQLNVEKLYQQNNNLPFWTTKNKTSQGIALIKSSKWHGLTPDDYYLPQIDSLLYYGWKNELPDTTALAYLDILLTEGIYTFCKHLANGKLQASDYHKSWNYTQTFSPDIDSVLPLLINENKVDSIASYFQPKSKEYYIMYNETKHLSELRDSLFEFTVLQYPGELMRKGDSGLYVKQLRQALSERKLIVYDSANNIFDEQLELAVKSFQINHGLIPDGVPGPNTYNFLSWSIDDYINNLKINMERTRWMPDHLPSTNLQINIPSCEIFLHKKEQLIFNGKVIVGKFKNQTPVFTSEINYLVFNPCWTVPSSIATKKMLPKIKKDSSYLDKRNMFITLKGKVLIPDSINFSEYNESNFPFKIYQRSDNKNALGKVKFMFQNPYNIYLHDTPGKYLFKKDHRIYSQGCIRVQHALELSDIILQKLDNHKIDKSFYLEKGYPEKVYLKKNIPISILYLTCKYNSKLKRLQYFKDVYYLDNKVLHDLVKR
jgi:murein L,D-transpeptidase YcbB/YkuD